MRRLSHGCFPRLFESYDDRRLRIHHEGILDVGVNHFGDDVTVASLGAIDCRRNKCPDFLDGNAGLWPGIDANGAAVRYHRRPSRKQSAIDAADRSVELRADQLLHPLRNIRQVFELRNILDHRQHLLDGVDGSVLVARVSRPADGRDVEVVPAAMRDIDLHVGELGENAVVELVPAKQINAAGLLAHVVGDGGKRELALEIRPALDQRLDAADQRAEFRLSCP